MRLLIAVLIVLHGLVHYLGFAKGYGLAALPGLTSFISRSWGSLWWLAGSLCLVAAGWYLARPDRSWGWLLLAAGLSQLVVVAFWADARWGTMVNVLMGVMAIGIYGQSRFTQAVDADRAALVAAAQPPATGWDSLRLAALPPPVRRWLEQSGALAQPQPHLVSASQVASMKLKPDQTRWTEAKARQVVSISPPGFVWDVEMDLMGVLPVRGRDRYQAGRGEMSIKLWGLIPVVAARDDPKIDEGTLQRYLGEIVWYPAAAVQPYIEWEALDAYSARATMTWGEVSGSGTFFFDEAGDFIRFSAWRYQGGGDAATRHEWVIEVKDRSERDGIVIPSHMTATWRLPAGDWMWLDLHVTDLKFSRLAR